MDKCINIEYPNIIETIQEDVKLLIDMDDQI